MLLPFSQRVVSVLAYFFFRYIFNLHLILSPFPPMCISNNSSSARSDNIVIHLWMARGGEASGKTENLFLTIVLKIYFEMLSMLELFFLVPEMCVLVFICRKNTPMIACTVKFIKIYEQCSAIAVKLSGYERDENDFRSGEMIEKSIFIPALTRQHCRSLWSAVVEQIHAFKKASPKKSFSHIFVASEVAVESLRLFECSEEMKIGDIFFLLALEINLSTQVLNLSFFMK